MTKFKLHDVVTDGTHDGVICEVHAEMGRLDYYTVLFPGGKRIESGHFLVRKHNAEVALADNRYIHTTR